jgi:glycosyltransferase involved in cell wall biosynthesis
LRILHVVPTYLPAVRYGGPIYSVHGLARALVGLGHEVHVLTTNIDGAGISAVPLNRPVDIDGVKVWYHPVRWPRKSFRSPPLSDAVTQMLPQTSIVHLHSVFLWPTWAAARASRKAGASHIISPRGMLIKDLIRRRSRIAKSIWIGLIERTNVERACAVHLTSQIERAELERFGWQLPRLAVIPNGIDEPVVAAGAIGADVRAIAAAQPLVLFLGRLSWKKGLDHLLHAFARTGVGKLAIVGTDDENLAPQLVKLATSLRLEDRVRILPRTVVGAEKEHLFAAARLFVLPSHSENFGNTVLEALRRCVPVAVTQGVGAADVVRQSGGGIVVGADPEVLGTAINRFTTDESLARSMGEAGQRHVMAHYTWAQIAARMEDLYRALNPSKNNLSTRCPN